MQNNIGLKIWSSQFKRMNKLIVGLSTLIFSGILYGQAKIDTTKVEELIIQENRLQIPFNQTARNVQIITKEEIARLPVKSINELLSYIGGVDLRQRGPFGSQADISIDGGSFEQTLVLLNGVKLLDAQTAHNMLNIPVPLDAVERIEVLKGPAARVYGINALTGAVNIVTKQSAQSFVSVNTYSGSSFEKKADGDGKGIYAGGGIQATGNFGTEKQSHLFSISKDKYNGQRYNTAQDNTRLFYNGNYKFNENHSLQWLGAYTFNDFGANGFYAAPGDKESREIVETALFSVSSKHKFGRFTLSPRISNRYNEDDYRYFRNDISKARSKHYSNAFMAEINASVKTKIGDFGIGSETRLESINSSNIGKHERVNQGLYAEYKGFYWNKVVANAGAYANYNSNYGWQVYPGVDLAYLFSPGWKLAFNAGSGQRIPSFTDLYLNQKPGNVGNPDLKPENAWQYEANIQYSYKKLKVQVGYFYRDVSNFIDWVRDTVNVPYSPVNFGRNQIHGINARISQQFLIKEKHTLGYFVSYNFLHPEYRSTNNVQSKYILESLKNQFIVGLNYGYKFFDFQINSRVIQRELHKPYVLLDMKANFKIKSFAIYGEVTNTLNTTYIEAGAVPMPSRWFSLGLRYNWSKK